MSGVTVSGFRFCGLVFGRVLTAADWFCGLSTGPVPGSGVWWLLRPWGWGPFPGWSGRCGGRAARRFPQVHPFPLAVPALGQVQDEAAPAVAGGAGGDRDQVTADGRGAGLREREA